MKKYILITISILFSSCAFAQPNNQFGNSVNADFYQNYVKPFDVEGEINFDLISEIYEVFGLVNKAEFSCNLYKNSVAYGTDYTRRAYIEIVSSNIETLEDFKDSLNYDYVDDYNLSKDFVNKVNTVLNKAINLYEETLKYLD